MSTGGFCNAHYQCLKSDYCSTKVRKWKCVKKKRSGACSQGLECAHGSLCIEGNCVGGSGTAPIPEPLPMLSRDTSVQPNQGLSASRPGLSRPESARNARKIIRFSLAYEASYTLRTRYFTGLSRYSLMFGGLRFSAFLGYVEFAAFWHGGTSFASKKGFHMDVGADMQFLFLHPYAGLFKVSVLVLGFGLGYRGWLTDVRHNVSPYFESHSMDFLLKIGAFVSKNLSLNVSVKHAALYYYRYARNSKRFTFRPLEQLHGALNLSYLF